MQLFDLQYFGNFNYYFKLLNNTNNTILLYDEWYKMGFLNRCWVLGANKRLELTVPIVGGRNQHSQIGLVKIDYTQTWQKNHIRAIMTSYAKSPFFEFYYPEVEKILKTKFEFLWELNAAILQQTCKWLKHSTPTILHEPLNLFEDHDSTLDFRKQFIPKKMVQLPTLATYNQVFMNKHGFVPHLSILDLLFCEGPRAKQILTSP